MCVIGAFYAIVLSWVFLSGFLLFLSGLIASRGPILLTPYESGFEGVGGVRVGFSVHFYQILLLFLVFDLEVVLLFTYVAAPPTSSPLFLLTMVFVFGSYYLEGYLGSLHWVT